MLNGIRRLVAKPDVLQSKPLAETIANTQSNPLAESTGNTQSKLLSSTNVNTQSKPLADTIYNTVSKPLVDNTQIKLFADTVDMHVAANNDELESSPETDSHVIETNTSDFQSKVVDLPATKTDINFSKDSYRTKTLISGTFESNSKTKPLIIIQPYVARHYSTSLKVKGGESNFSKEGVSIFSKESLSNFSSKGGESNFSKEGVSNFSKEGLSNFSSKGDVSNFTPKESLSDEMSKKIAPISFLYKQHELRDHRCQSNI